MKKWFQVAKISKPHGTKGELRVLSGTDFPEERFKIGNTLYLKRDEENEFLPLVIKSHRKHKQFELLTFEDYQRVETIETWKGATLHIPEEQLSSLPEGEFYYHEILGCDVFSEEGDRLGTIKDILETGANDVWVVSEYCKKDILIPYIDDVVKNVDVQNKRVTIHLLEGLI